MYSYFKMVYLDDILVISGSIFHTYSISGWKEFAMVYVAVVVT